MKQVEKTALLALRGKNSKVDMLTYESVALVMIAESRCRSEAISASNLPEYPWSLIPGLYSHSS